METLFLIFVRSIAEIDHPVFGESSKDRRWKLLYCGAVPGEDLETTLQYVQNFNFEIVEVLIRETRLPVYLSVGAVTPQPETREVRLVKPGVYVETIF